VQCCGSITFHSSMWSTLNMDAAWISLKRWYPSKTLHGVTTQKTLTWIFTAVNTSNLAT
jgi:hypothetical protein